MNAPSPAPNNKAELLQTTVQHVDITFREDPEGFEIECAVTTIAQTGVEMEALTGVAVAALTIYDMCKAVDKTMEISGVRLVSKTKESI